MGDITKLASELQRVDISFPTTKFFFCFFVLLSTEETEILSLSDQGTML